MPSEKITPAIGGSSVSFERLATDANAFLEHTKVQEKKFDAFASIEGIGRIIVPLKAKLPSTFKGTALIVCDPSNANEVVAAVTKFVQEGKGDPVLVLLNYTAKAAQRFFGEHKVSGVRMIDTVTQSISRFPETPNVQFVDSVRNLTQTQITMIRALEEKPSTVFVVDSVGMLFLYHEPPVVIKFFFSLSSILHKHNATSFFVCAGKPNESILQFFDEVITLPKFA